jgi:hypothetical protein
MDKVGPKRRISKRDCASDRFLSTRLPSRMFFLFRPPDSCMARRPGQVLRIVSAGIDLKPSIIEEVHCLFRCIRMHQGIVQRSNCSFECDSNGYNYVNARHSSNPTSLLRVFYGIMYLQPSIRSYSFDVVFNIQISHVGNAGLS